jgi:hypothetical protein
MSLTEQYKQSAVLSGDGKARYSFVFVNIVSDSVRIMLRMTGLRLGKDEMGGIVLARLSSFILI